MIFPSRRSTAPFSIGSFLYRRLLTSRCRDCCHSAAWLTPRRGRGALPGEKGERRWRERAGRRGATAIKAAVVHGRFLLVLSRESSFSALFYSGPCSALIYPLRRGSLRGLAPGMYAHAADEKKERQRSPAIISQIELIITAGPGRVEFTIPYERADARDGIGANRSICRARPSPLSACVLFFVEGGRQIIRACETFLAEIRA